MRIKEIFGKDLIWYLNFTHKFSKKIKILSAKMRPNLCSADFGWALARAHSLTFEHRSHKMSARSESRSIEWRSLKLCWKLIKTFLNFLQVLEHAWPIPVAGTHCVKTGQTELIVAFVRRATRVIHSEDVLVSKQCDQM